MRTPHTRHRDDSGVALLTVVFVLVLVGALTLTLAVLTINNLTSARLAQQAGAALNASDAGVAQAVTYMRENGVKQLNGCSPTCATNPWGNKNSPATVTVPGKAGQKFNVWIEPLVKYPANEVGYYRIHSTGFSGTQAGRVTDVSAEIAGLPLPMGILASSVNGGGNAGVHYQSILSTGCVYKRSKIDFEGLDIIRNFPAAVHTSQIISDDQGSGKYCPGMNKPVHPTTGAPSTRYCNPTYPYDRDKNGGPLNGTSCYRTHNGTYPESSKLATDADLYSEFNIQPDAFTRAQLDQLKTIALSQQNYYTSASGWATPTAQHAVLYFDLTRNNPGGMVDLNYLTPTWSRAPGFGSELSCVCRPITGGDHRRRQRPNELQQPVVRLHVLGLQGPLRQHLQGQRHHLVRGHPLRQQPRPDRHRRPPHGRVLLVQPAPGTVRPPHLQLPRSRPVTQPTHRYVTGSVA